MFYTGLDVHTKRTQIQHMDEDGALGLSMNVMTDRSHILRYLDELSAPTSVTFEASGNYWWISQLLQDHPKVSEVNVVDPRRSRNLAKELSVQAGYGRAKNDRIDAEMLAEQARVGLAPAIHLPTPEQLHQRTLNRHRCNLVWEKTGNSNQIQALLNMHGYRISTKTLLEYDAAEISDRLAAHLPEYVIFIIDQQLNQIRLFQQQLLWCDEILDKLLPESAFEMKRLMSAPGIGPVVSRIIITEILSISYFDAPPYLISYSGLAPVEQDSDGKKGRIKLNRHCNYYLKYAFLIAAHAARRHPKYQRKYQHDVKKHGKIRAKLNIARKLAKSVYWMLTRQQPFL